MTIAPNSHLTFGGLCADKLIMAARDTSLVSGFTHNHYRYPARFSPYFARTVIDLLTKPGDVVLDPFMGGGTTLVEALALGRRAVGSDISSLAAFLAGVKTTVYTEADIERVSRWAQRLPKTINMHRHPDPSVRPEASYLRNLQTQQTWRIRKAIEQALASARTLKPQRRQDLARCIILRTAQWALDARKKVPSAEEYRTKSVYFAAEMLANTADFSNAVENVAPAAGRASCLHRSADELHMEPVFRSLPPPKLILTSPPYPGVHILYHRWQVDGRKETPAPFWIANKLDGTGAKYYTMGDRKEKSLRTYFANLKASFQSIRRLCDPSTTLVQLVAFADPDWQLRKYLEVLAETDFKEVLLDPDSIDGRAWRTVPNRRWHADQMGETSGSREVVLVHRPT